MHSIIKPTSTLLNAGIKELDSPLIKTLQNAFSKGRYLACLTEITPEFVRSGGDNDYFYKQSIASWGLDAFDDGIPHYPNTEYYRLSTKKIEYDSWLFEFLIPMYPISQLVDERVSKYSKLLNLGNKPTAISLSVLDTREALDNFFGLTKTEETMYNVSGFHDDVYTHYCLSHFLIDGHHKVCAAAKEQKPITLLSFIALDKAIFDEDVGNEYDADKILEILSI